MRQTLVTHDSPVNESIMFQIASAFFKELVLNFDALKKVDNKLVSDNDIVTTISKVIKHHTGLNITLNIGNADPQVTVPMVNKNNILVNSYIRNYLNSSDGLKMISESKSAAKGSVDLKSGMVTGIFTEVHSTIDLPITMFTTNQFTAEEVAAVTLHEIGHLFVYYEFMSRSVSTNQMLAGLSKALDNSGTVEEREVILITAKKAMDLKSLDTKALAKSSNKKVIEMVVITNISKETKSELGSDIYDFSTWEYLADQYAARQGAGRPLALALGKYYKGHMSFRSTTGYLAMECVKVLLIISPLAIAGLTGTIIGLPMLLGILLIVGDSDSPTYDRPGERLKRIRDQVVENLKNKKLSKDDIIRLEEDLEAVDKLLAEANDRRQFFGALQDLLFPSSRKARSQEALQKELEDLAVNELFVKAAMLSKAA